MKMAGHPAGVGIESCEPNAVAACGLMARRLVSCVGPIRPVEPNHLELLSTMAQPTRMTMRFQDPQLHLRTTNEVGR